MDLENIGLQLKKERIKLGLTQSQAGERSGLDHTVVSRIERGRYTGSLKGYRRYLSSLGFQLSIERIAPVRPNFNELREIFDDD